MKATTEQEEEAQLKPRERNEITRGILREKGYHLIQGGHTGQPGDINRSRLEFWNGPKGVVILQIWDDNGCTAYSNWHLGHTYDELREAL